MIHSDGNLAGRSPVTRTGLSAALRWNILPLLIERLPRSFKLVRLQVWVSSLVGPCFYIDQWLQSRWPYCLYTPLASFHTTAHPHSLCHCCFPRFVIAISHCYHLAIPSLLSLSFLLWDFALAVVVTIFCFVLSPLPSLLSDYPPYLDSLLLKLFVTISWF